MGQMLGSTENENPVFHIKEIAVVKRENECHSVVERLRRECNNSFPVLGMDCEWIPDFGKKNPVALLQLATLHGFCALFRLSHMPRLPSVLKNLLMDENILKVGVGIENDISRLPTNVRGWMDIRHLEFLVRMYPAKGSVEDSLDNNRIKLSLAALAKRILGVVLNKDIRYTDWESEQLSDEQIKYAAMDALAAVLICYELTHQEEAIKTYSLEPIEFLERYQEKRYKELERAYLYGRSS